MIKKNDILKSFNKTMIFQSANQTSQVKAFLHGLVNPCMLITYTPGTQGTYAEVFSQRKAANIAHQSGRAHIKLNPTAEVMFEKAKYKVNKLIIQIRIFRNEENSDEIMTNGD